MEGLEEASFIWLEEKGQSENAKRMNFPQRSRMCLDSRVKGVSAGGIRVMRGHCEA